MKILVHRFESGKFSGWLVFWKQYRTFIRREHGWRGHYPKSYPRFRTMKPWWSAGSLMLIDSRICWDTQLNCWHDQ